MSSGLETGCMGGKKVTELKRKAKRIDQREDKNMKREKRANRLRNRTIVKCGVGVLRRELQKGGGVFLFCLEPTHEKASVPPAAGVQHCHLQCLCVCE